MLNPPICLKTTLVKLLHETPKFRGESSKRNAPKSKEGFISFNLPKMLGNKFSNRILRNGGEKWSFTMVDSIKHHQQSKSKLPIKTSWCHCMMRINLSMIDGEQKSYVPLTSLRMLLFAMQPGPTRIFPHTFSSKNWRNISPQNNSLDKTHSSYRDINYKSHYSIHDLPWVSSLDQHKFTPQKNCPSCGGRTCPETRQVLAVDAQWMGSWVRFVPPVWYIKVIQPLQAGWKNPSCPFIVGHL